MSTTRIGIDNTIITVPTYEIVTQEEGPTRLGSDDFDEAVKLLAAHPSQNKEICDHSTPGWQWNPKDEWNDDNSVIIPSKESDEWD
jgi:hypothetical protein